jgi:VWFA-related protein
MSFWRRIALSWVAAHGTVFVAAQGPAPPPEVLHVTTQLVVLDATVLDKAGHVVTQPLTRDDFLIEENKKPQEIYSFESAAEHSAAAASGDSEKSPKLIFVLDELNYAYAVAQTSSWNVMEQLNQYVYERQELLAYLKAQPETLQESAEVLILTHHGYRVLVAPTRDRGVLLDRVGKHDPGLGSPFRDFIEETGYGGSRDYTLSKDSLEALWSLALQQRSMPGRKVVVWLGYGGPSGAQLGRPRQGQHMMLGVQPYQRVIADLLVEARINLDVLTPGVGDAPPPAINPAAIAQYNNNYSFESDFGFSGYIASTGGQFKRSNDVRGEIQTSVKYGTSYYTMSYRPSNHGFNGDFRRVHVMVKDHPEWTVLTKAGYYAMRFGGETDVEHQQVSDLSIATFEPMPFTGIGATLTQIERIKGTDSARFIFRLDSDDLQWHTDSATKVREADIAVSGAALGSVFAKATLSSEVASWKLTVPLETDKASIHSEVSVTFHIPPKTQRLRFAIRDTANGRMGTVDLNPAAMASALVKEAPTPTLEPREPARKQ